MSDVNESQTENSRSVPAPPPAIRQQVSATSARQGAKGDSQVVPPPAPEAKRIQTPPPALPPKKSSAAPPATRAATARVVADVRTPEASSQAARRPLTRRERVKEARSRKAAFKKAEKAKRSEERRKVPSWLVSFIVHVAIILILAMVPLRDLAQGPLTFFLSQGGSVGIAEFELSGGAASSEITPLDAELTPIAQPATQSSELLNLDLPTLASPKPELPTSVLPSAAEVSFEGFSNPLADLPLGISQGLTGRIGGNKAALLGKFGGSAETEAAVEMGLEWLVRQQKSNGGWSLIGPYSGGGAAENTTAATALALNAFLGAGYTHLEGKYRTEVNLGLKYLISKQSDDGFFADREPSRQQMYAQAIATITVIEAYGLSHDDELRYPAEKALRFAEWSQSKLRGWRYNPREDADLSVTGWFVMALETGLMAGLKVDREKLEQVSEFLDSVSSDENSRYAYNHFEPASLSMTAEGLLCRILLGWPKSQPALLRAIQDDLLPTSPSLEDRDYSVYYWYYATQVLHHVGGNAWDEWNTAMKKTIPALQQTQGPEKGSWDPSIDAYGASGGRLYTTCLNIFCLEVYYRHLSIYDPR